MKISRDQIAVAAYEYARDHGLLPINKEAKTIASTLQGKYEFEGGKIIDSVYTLGIEECSDR